MTSVRSGADAFFQIPVDINRLVDRIESFVNLDLVAPIKALLLDSDSLESEFHSFILKESGMETTCISDPEKSIQTIIETSPDIIIMDYYIGLHKAAELAALIRQQDAFLSIPILFVAGESREDLEIEALLLGGDDVISKPVSAQELVIAVRSKALRSRQIRYYMERDSLTGLLNHTNLKEALSREIMRAKRDRTELCFVMIDIDHFKSVNDIYGHLTGDKVLKSLSYLLQERLRQTDIIGRYGGEEFGIILPKTSASDASLIINKLRGGFSRLKQTGSDTTFNVTFSAGIAVYPILNDAATVAQCADKALYEAKELGRNQVCVYSEEQA
jgi:diguanylate cyclase (GGDEF)-like protein